jgi:hypothetical protein
MISGRLHYRATALDPLHHGAGSSGNTQLLRRQDIILDDGTRARVPFVSGNSWKHKIRESGAQFALDAMGIEGGLKKAVIDLLFSGGALTKTGSAVNLSQARKLEKLFPIVSICGYSAGNTMTSSKLSVEPMHLACKENTYRVHSEIADLLPQPIMAQKAAAYLSEDFGTRHEQMKNPNIAKLLEVDSRNLLEATISGNATEVYADKGDSIQMIYEFETIKAGAQFFGCIHFRGLNALELCALQSALSYGCEGTTPDNQMIYRVGAKSSVGFGRIAVQWVGSLREDIRPPNFEDAEALTTFSATDKMRIYIDHLQSHRDEIVATLEAIV